MSLASLWLRLRAWWRREVIRAEMHKIARELRQSAASSAARRRER